MNGKRGANRTGLPKLQTRRLVRCASHLSLRTPHTLPLPEEKTLPDSHLRAGQFLFRAVTMLEPPGATPN